MGPMTGWGRGYCGGSVPARGFGGAYGGRGRGAAWGRGGGGGRGWRHRSWATGEPGWARGRWGFPELIEDEPPPAIEKQYLAERRRLLRSELQAIKMRLNELDAAEAEGHETTGRQAPPDEGERE
jgi:Family of unknown function (DUF5320)